MSNHDQPPRGQTSYRPSDTGDDVTRQNVQAMRKLEEAAMARRAGARRRPGAARSRSDEGR